MKVANRLPIGIEIDRDLNFPLTPDEEDRFRELFFSESLLLFRGQQLSASRQVELCRILGPVPTGDGSPHTVALDGLLGAGELAFHSDMAFDPDPFVGVSLHAVAIDPPGGTSTKFVDGITAYETLPDDLRARVEERFARHVFPTRTDVRDPVRPQLEAFPQAVRPAVWRHPQTCEPILYVSQQATTEIIGLSPGESEELLTALFDHLYKPGRVFEHRWHKGDLVLWDNLALQHARGSQAGVRLRTMQRVVMGRGTVGQLYGDFLQSYSQQLMGVAHSAYPEGVQ